MLRLRLRVASSGVTHKLELPAGCSWEGLQNAARQAVGLDSDVHIVLSLNKKVGSYVISDRFVFTLNIFYEGLN